MSPDSFCYWLNGFFEISGQSELTPQQVQIIKDHLTLVFNKVTPFRYTKGIELDPSIKFPYTIDKLNVVSCSLNTSNDPPVELCPNVSFSLKTKNDPPIGFR